MHARTERTADGSAERPDEPAVAPGWVVVNPPGLVPGPFSHLVLGAGGVIAVALWAGDVTVVDGVVHQDGRRRELQCQDLVRDAFALAALLHPDHRALVAPVVLVADDRVPVRLEPGLVLMGRDRFAWMLEGLPTHLGPDDVADVAGRVAQSRARRSDQLPTQASLAADLTRGRGKRRPRV